MNYERTIEKIQGEVATLLCEVEGIPAPSVTWKKNYVQIDTESNPNYDILEDGSLPIKQVKVLVAKFFPRVILICLYKEPQPQKPQMASPHRPKTPSTENPNQDPNHKTPNHHN